VALKIAQQRLQVVPFTPFSGASSFPLDHLTAITDDDCVSRNVLRSRQPIKPIKEQTAPSRTLLRKERLSLDHTTMGARL
jgi:hypothetical protein